MIQPMIHTLAEEGDQLLNSHSVMVLDSLTLLSDHTLSSTCDTQKVETVPPKVVKDHWLKRGTNF